MESTEKQPGLLQQIIPPRLEDAGLEDPALPPESIHEAFLKAAAAVKSRIFTSSGEDDCIDDPKPAGEDASDVVGVIEPENEEPGACVDGLQGLEKDDVKEKEKSEEKEKKKEKKPILVGGYV
jgi:hypothetical protein